MANNAEDVWMENPKLLHVDGCISDHRVRRTQATGVSVFFVCCTVLALINSKHAAQRSAFESTKINVL